MNTFSLIFIAFYLLIFFGYGFFFFKTFAPKNHQQTFRQKIRFFLSNAKMWLSFLLAFSAAMTLFLPIGTLSEWLSSPTMTKLQKVGQDKVIILGTDEKKIYTDLVYQKNGTPFSVFWDKKKAALVVEKVSKTSKVSKVSPEKKRESFLLAQNPFFFEENSNLSRLPLSSTLSDGQNIRLRPLEKNIQISWQGKPEKFLPHAFEETSKFGLDYSLGDAMFFLSYTPQGKIFNRIFMHQKDFVAQPIIDEKVVGHFHSPYYWRSQKALFFTGIERKMNQKGEKVVVFSLYLKSFADDERKIIFKTSLAQADSLSPSSLFILKISGSPDGQFFAHHDAISEKNFLIFYWMKHKNHPFIIKWKSLKKISSFAISPMIQDQKKYQISLLGENDAGQQTIVTSHLTPQKAKATQEKTPLELGLIFILTVLGGALYALGLLLMRKQRPAK